MADPDFFSSTKVVIFGLGLMGGSMAMGLRGRCRCLTAVETDEETCELAKNLNLVDEISSNPLDVIQNADLIILATPVKTILSLIQHLPDWIDGSPIVLDLGSTKTEICRALSSLPARFDAVGGHPMCGKEELGLKNADANIYNQAIFAFTRLPCSSPRSIRMAEQLAKILGAYPFWIDAETHDRWAASTSHIPYLVASALVLSLPAEVKPLIGPGLRSTTRLASTPPSMMMDVLSTNRQNVLKALNQFQIELDEIVDLLTKQKDREMNELMVKAAQSRKMLIQETMFGGGR